MRIRDAFLLAVCFQTSGLRADSVFASDGGKPWQQWPVDIVRPARAADEVNEYGGLAKVKTNGTGFFRVMEASRKWWMIDPDGHLFIMKGVNSVEPERVGHPDPVEWARKTYNLLRNAGFNTIGRWSDHEAFKNAGVPVPWCNTMSFMKEYAKRRPSRNGKSGFPKETIPVFDKEWPGFCEEYAEKELAGLKDDKWLIGHFSDNELPFRPDALEKYLDLPEEDAGHQGALAWMRENRVTPAKTGDEKVQKEFLEMVARLYFETVAAALKKADPNHLNLGSRLHGRAINESTVTAAGACDVISINYYHRWEPEVDRMKDWAKWSGRPFFVSEFYAMKVAGEETVADGAGFRVLNYEDAAAFYHTHTAILLEDVPSCVGWHWFKYANDTPEAQKGIVGNDGEVHRPLFEGMKVLNDQAYSLRGAR